MRRVAGFTVILFFSTGFIYVASHLLGGGDNASLGSLPAFLLISLALSVLFSLLINRLRHRGLFRHGGPSLSEGERKHPGVDPFTHQLEHVDPTGALSQALKSIPKDADYAKALSEGLQSMHALIEDRLQLASHKQKELEQLFDVVPCYITVQDRNFRIVRSNRLFRQDFGELDEKPCYEVYKNLKSPCPNCSVAKTFQDGKIRHNEEEVMTRNGERVSLIVYAAPIRDESGKIIAVMEMSTNISEIKRLQRELNEERQKYEQMFNIVPCYISVQDRDFTILQTNEMFRAVFGKGIGKKCYNVYKGALGPCPDCPVVKTFQDGRVHSGEEHVVAEEGKEANVIVYTSPILDESGRVKAVMEMSTDITAVKNLQRELVQMGQTIASTAHRIKNILMGLEGGVFVVSTALEEKNDDLLKEGWDMVNRNVEKVSHIVKGLLYCSKQRTPQFMKTNPNRIAEEVHQLFKEKAREDDIRMELDLAEAMPDADLDPDSIHDLLSNLVSNALDACKFDTKKPDHWIRLRTRVQNPDRILYEVSDNGPGIPAETKAKVFDRFFSTKGDKGTGLGLQIARKVVQEHRGDISLSTETDLGTTFHITIPFHQDHTK